MKDFTLDIYQVLLKELADRGYAFQPFCEFIKNSAKNSIILRHDVDDLPKNSLRTAIIENELGIKGTYYFRITSNSNQPEIIRSIALLGHEIGYHYEDLARCKGNLKEAIKSFQNNLAYFQQFGPIETICMHGSPLSSYDNRGLWDKYNYRDFGILAEPYFDLDDKVLYLTDTGRCWDGEKMSVRDKSSYKTYMNKVSFHSTFDIISAANLNKLPSQIMITVHPQRWTNNTLSWLKEFYFQNTKNMIKRLLIK
jgi:hypothetical protein